MTLSLLDSPEKVALVKNPVAFRVSTNNFVTAAASQAHLHLVFSDLPSDGDIMTLEWGINSVTFTFQAGLFDDNGLNIAIPASMDPAVLCPAIAAAMMKNYLISRDFTVDFTGISAAVIVNARLPGSAFTLTPSTLPSVIDGSTNISGVDEVTRANFKAIMQIWSYATGPAGIDELIIELEQTPDINSDCIFEAQDYLRPLLKYNTAAIGDTSGDTLCIAPYFVQFVEFYGDVPKAQGPVLKSEILYILNGGIKKIDYPSFSFFDTWLPTNKKFLTWEPTEKIISKEQPEVLYYLNAAGFGSLIARAIVHYSDGTTASLHISAGISMSQYKVYSIPIDYSIVAAEANPAKTILKYSVDLIDSDDVSHTESRTYIIDKKRKFERYFFYANSFGVFNCLRTYGAATISDDMLDIMSEIKIPYNYALPDAESKRNLVTSQDSIKVSTGYLPSTAWKKTLQDFLRSELIVEYKNGTLLPVVMLTKKDSYNENDPIHSILFEYRYGYTDNAFSNANDYL